MGLSTRAATLKQEMEAALKKELEIARKASSGERANEVTEGIRTRKKGNSFVLALYLLSPFKRGIR